jgi:serine protease Do
VHIEAEKVDATSLRNGRRGEIKEAGSGFIIMMGHNYYVVTNCHVVNRAATRDIKIRLDDGREIHPLKVLTDKETDVAIMSIAAPNLIPSRLGNSDDLEIGDFVLAVGSPFGLSHSVTFGIISAERRRDLELDSDVKYQDFLQTDAAINPGNSGGPLFNLRGEVIGMNTAIASNSGANEGIGFAIPINMVKIISHQLIDRGYVVRGRLGIGLDRKFSTTTVGIQLPRGAKITEIKPGTAAEAAKLQVGDIIVKFDGVPVENDQHLVNLVSLAEVDRVVPIVVSRGGQTLNLTVKIGSEPSTRAATPAGR